MKTERDWIFNFSVGSFCLYGALALFSWYCFDDTSSHRQEMPRDRYSRATGAFEIAKSFHESFRESVDSFVPDVSQIHVDDHRELPELGNATPLRVKVAVEVDPRPHDCSIAAPIQLAAPTIARRDVQVESTIALAALDSGNVVAHVVTTSLPAAEAHLQACETEPTFSKNVSYTSNRVVEASIGTPILERPIEVEPQAQQITVDRSSVVPAVSVSTLATDFAMAILDNPTRRAQVPYHESLRNDPAGRTPSRQNNEHVPMVTTGDDQLMLPSISLSITDKSDGEPVLRVPVTQKPEFEEDIEKSEWPPAKTLFEEMNAMEQGTATQTWISQVKQTLDQLRRSMSIGSETAYASLITLEELADSLDDRARNTRSLVERSELERVSYSLRRRTEIWLAANSASLTKTDVDDEAFQALGATTIALSNVDGILTQMGAQAWRDYLLVDQALEVYHPSNLLNERQGEVAKQIIGRLNSRRLTDEQVDFLQGVTFDELRRSLAFWLQRSVDVPRMLQLVEWYEQYPSDVLAQQIAEQVDVLFNVEDDGWYAFGQQVDLHYRNANFRVAISKELINRMIPSTPPVDEVVRDNVLGASVSGTSQIWNSLRIHTIPDERRLVLGLQADGIVHSRTRASKSGFTFHDKGVAKFTSEKRIAIDNNGIQIAPATARASSNQQMLDMTSQYDSVPFIGSLARRIALQQRTEQESQARRLVERKIGVKARTRFDREFVTYLDDASRKLDERLIEPLESLDLRPTPIQLSSTDSRCIVRCRLAGGTQMGASTPRPLALTNSVFSTQIHRSAANNFIGQLDLNGRKFTLEELHEHLNSRLASTDIRMPERDETEEEVTIKFATRDCISIDFEQDEVIVNLRIAELQIQSGKRRRNFEASVHYIPRVDGISVKLTRNPDQPIELESKRLTFGDRVALLGVLNKVFSKKTEIDVTPSQLVEDPRTQGLFISQLVAHDGWIGMSVSSIPNARIKETSQEASRRRLPRRIR